ncbi:MAG: M20/M25/M40 family metallo-hydrolase [Candidatus Falkowbacteria bacterium]
MINKQRLIKLFCELVKIKSPTGSEEQISRRVIFYLKKFGAKVQRDKFGNIVAKLVGTGKPLILCAHLDTVAVGAGKNIRPIIKKGKIFSDGKTILGADNKDSIAAILEMLNVIKENKIKHCPAAARHRALEIVFTREEEAISRGARSLDLSLLKGKECIISDHCNEYGTIVTSAPGCYKFEIKIFGKRCHVKEPEKGINAIKIAAEIIRKIPLGKVDNFTNANIGYQIAGLDGVVNKAGAVIDQLFNENRNTVPDLAILLGEVRGVRSENLQRALLKIQKIAEKITARFCGRIEFCADKLTDGYCLKQNNKLILQIKNTFKKQGIEPQFCQALGGSDANILNNRGIRSVVIASAHRNNHQTYEYLIIKDLERLAEFYLLFVQ